MPKHGRTRPPLVFFCLDSEIGEIHEACGGNSPSTFFIHKTMALWGVIRINQPGSRGLAGTESGKDHSTETKQEGKGLDEDP